MPTNPNKISQFWQELKRRKVVRVITVYAAAAFVILELVSIIIEPLKLPEWTLPMIIVLLCVGFIIAAILSWIYDIHPEDGMVKTEPADKVKQAVESKSSNSWKIASYISFVVIVGLVAMNIINRNEGRTEPLILDKSIAVLPFENISQEEGNEHFVDGLVEDLLNRISVIEELKVISRTSSEMYRERGVKSIPQIAEELKVAYILEGSVQRYGDKARITVQLIDAKNDDHIWADSYDRDIGNVFQTQSEIAIQVASKLDAILTSEQESQMYEEKTRNIKAFELYQMGRFYWNKRTGEAYAESIKYFEQAIEADPGYGLAYAGLADTYFLMALQGQIEIQEGRDKAVELAYKALKLDGTLSEAYTVLGSLYDYIDWDWGKAEDSFQHALELNPNYSTAHQYYAEHLTMIGRPEEARIHINKALELNPLSFVIRHLSARFYYHQGNFKEALKELNISEEIQKGHHWTRLYKFYVYYQLDREDEAFEALRELLAENPHYSMETAEKIFEESGLKAVLQWKVENDINSEERPYSDIANNLALLGKYDEAIRWLEEGFQLDKIGVGISYYIHFRSLLENPRYQAILKGMGLGD